jgi:hypothetical protein
MLFGLRDVSRCCLLLVAGLGTAGRVRGAEPFESFLKTHCVRCHGPEKEEAAVRMDRLSRDFRAGTDTSRWADVLERVNAGEMPPDTEPRPAQDEIAAFVAHLDTRLKEGQAARMAARPAVAHYRLSRREYQNTVYDLLGVRYDPTVPGELNEDALWHGYERIGSQLSLSPSHVDRYYRAAGIVLDRAFPTAPVEPCKVRTTAAEYYARKDSDLAKEIQAALDQFGIKRPLRYLLIPIEDGIDFFALRSQWLANGAQKQPRSGLYRMRMQASGIRPRGGQLPHLRIGPRDPASRLIAGLAEFDITAPEDAPQVYEAEIYLDMPTDLNFQVVAANRIPRYANQFGAGKTYIFTHSSEPWNLNQNSSQVFDDKGNSLFSVVIVDWIEWEGPLESEAEQARRTGLLPPEDASPEVVAEHLERFATRAWRRPVKHEELADYQRAYRTEREAGEKTADAFRVAMRGVLTADEFLYLVEGAPEPRERLADFELASRLSYFLWSSMPDDGLFAAAGGVGLKGAGLDKEVDRMLADGKIGRFVEDFSRQWLQLHRVGMFPPDKKLYPTYDAWLEKSMRGEPVEFFREMFSQNLPIEGFIDSDWTIANTRLCEFYGLPEPKTSSFQRVAVTPESHRGGLLAMAAVLGLTSDGMRHRPVHRGVWLSEAIFGKTPPPPPPNVDPIEPTPPDGQKATLRDKLAAHRSNAACAACHAKIDPLGLAWDNYDAIGQWRTHEKVPQGVGNDPPVDPSGTLPDGRSFADSVEFKRLLLADREAFAQAFVEHLCTYALRRVLTVDDRDDVAAIVAEAAKHDYRVRDIVRAVALSNLIRKR